MCLYIKSYTRRRIAKRDIPVFKVLRRIRGRLQSPYQHATYAQGETKRVRLEKVRPNKWFRRHVNIGLHAFVSKWHAKELAISRQGRSADAIVLVDMIVPKGSAYYLGSKGDIVSSRLQWPA